MLVIEILSPWAVENVHKGDAAGTVRQHVTTVAEAYAKYSDQDVTFVGFADSEVDSMSGLLKFSRRYGITWPTALATGLLEDFSIGAFQTVVVGADGKTVWNSTMPGTLESAIVQAMGAAAK